MRLWHGEVFRGNFTCATDSYLYTPTLPQLDEADSFIVKLVVDSVSGTSPQIGAALQVSGDNRTWTDDAVPIITVTAVSPNTSNVLIGSMTGPKAQFQRIAINQRGTNVSCNFTVTICCRGSKHHA